MFGNQGGDVVIKIDLGNLNGMEGECTLFLVPLFGNRVHPPSMPLQSIINYFLTGGSKQKPAVVTHYIYNI